MLPHKPAPQRATLTLQAFGKRWKSLGIQPLDSIMFIVMVPKRPAAQLSVVNFSQDDTM